VARKAVQMMNRYPLAFLTVLRSILRS
jgi:hypothetical protein